MNKSFSIRKERYESSIKKSISRAIVADAYDDLIRQATILKVELNNDYSIAKIFISTHEESMAQAVLNKMNQAVSFFKKILADELELRKVPNLVFLIDESEKNFNEVEKILQEIKGQ